MNCKGHIEEDVAIAKVLAALWEMSSEREAYDRWMKGECTATEGRIADAVLSLLAATIEHMKGPCVEHTPQVQAFIATGVTYKVALSSLPRYYPTTRATRMTRARGELDVAVHKVAEEHQLSIVDVLGLLHSATHPWICAAEGEEAERRKAGEIL